MTGFRPGHQLWRGNAQRRIAFYADDELAAAFDLQLPPAPNNRYWPQTFLAAHKRWKHDLLPAEPTADYLAADDRALAIYQPGEPISVTLVTPGNLFLETALALFPDLPVTQINPSGVEFLPEPASP